MTAPANIRWNYPAIVDLMLQHPDWTQGQIAREMGYTEAWFSVIVTSDAFKAMLAERRQEVNSMIALDLTTKLEYVAHLSVDELTRRLEDEREKIGIGTLMDAGNLALKSLGYGPKPKAAANVTVNVGLVPAQVLQAARDRMSATVEARPALPSPNDLPVTEDG